MFSFACLLKYFALSAISLFCVKIAPPHPDVINLLPLKEITPISPIVPVCFLWLYIEPILSAASSITKIPFFYKA